MNKVREDCKGLYVKAGGYIARPGAVRGYDHALLMDDGGLKAGDTVAARHLPGTELTRIRLPDGSSRTWHHEGKARDDNLRPEAKIEELKAKRNTVFVVMKNIPYEADEIVGVYASEEKAEAEAKMLTIKDKRNFYHFHVERHKVLS